MVYISTVNPKSMLGYTEFDENVKKSVLQITLQINVRTYINNIFVIYLSKLSILSTNIFYQNVLM